MNFAPAALAVLLLTACAAATDSRRSGLDFMTPATQALQRDDTQNPAMLWVLDGQALWSQAAGRGGGACADCHGDAAKSMRGVAARYPRFDASLGRPLELGERIAQCRVRQGVAPPAPESPERLALQAYVALQSRGLPIAPDDDSRLAPFVARGQSLYTQRIGQLNLSCAQCHDGLAGGHLGGSVIPQAHPTGYPIYRLEWQSLGSLQRRLRNCMSGVRAEPYAYGAPELVELELFLAARARGMLLETPAVRP
jgi:sulfur-oxidizing protein SoxA